MKKILLALFFSVVCFLTYGQVGIMGGGVSVVGGGTEYLSNGEFTGSTDWTLDSEFTIVSNQLVYDATAAANITQTDAAMQISLVQNTAYTLTFDVIATGGWKVEFYLYNYAATVYYEAVYSATGTGTDITLQFTTPDEDLDGEGFLLSATTATDWTIDNMRLTAD